MRQLVGTRSRERRAAPSPSRNRRDAASGGSGVIPRGLEIVKRSGSAINMRCVPQAPAATGKAEGLGASRGREERVQRREG